MSGEGGPGLPEDPEGGGEQVEARSERITTGSPSLEAEVSLGQSGKVQVTGWE